MSALCPTCQGRCRVRWTAYGVPSAIKLGEADHPDADECPSCDGLGVEPGDDFEDDE